MAKKCPFCGADKADTTSFECGTTDPNVGEFRRRNYQCYENEIERLKTENGRLKDKIKTMDEAIGRLGASNREYSARAAQKSAEIERLKARVAELEADLEAAKLMMDDDARNGLLAALELIAENLRLGAED